MEKICKICNLPKDNFSLGIKNGKSYTFGFCKDCEKEKNSKRSKKYYAENKKHVQDKHAEYVKNNKDSIKSYIQNYCIINDEKIKLQKYNYYLLNKEQLSETRKKYYVENKNILLQQSKNYQKNNREKISSGRRKRWKEDPQFRIRHIISQRIYVGLTKNGFSKNRKSILKYLPYTIEELKQHIESQFESWMNWNNMGKYIVSKWKDNDISTWTWQIDHIIPHSKFEYSSMEDKDFKKCWALNNLRPLSAKQNIKEGNRRYYEYKNQTTD